MLVVSAGCSGQGAAENDAATQAARAFRLAIDEDPARACELLAPGTLEELEATEGPCEDQLPRQGLAAGSGPAGEVEVYGKDALVRMGSDTVFLARFDDGWRVTAAGCTPVPDRPYDCLLEAG